MNRSRLRAVASASGVLVASAGTLAVLVADRPHVAPRALASNGDDLAFTVVWALATLCAVWLTITALACVGALLRGRPGAAARIARFGPPIARRLLETALVGGFAMLPSAAYATPAAPLVLHVGPGGRLTGVPGDPANDTPVVRSPPPVTTTTRSLPAVPRTTAAPTTAAPTTAPSTTAPPDTTSPTTTTSVAAPLPVDRPTVRAPADASATHAAPAASDQPGASSNASSAAHALEVRAGDSLWSIARAETTRVTGIARPDDTLVADYWERVIAANRSTLRSGNPSLIFPGERIRLPHFEH